jgi:hypothetical protein
MEKFILLVRTDIERLRKIPEEERYADWPDMLGWVKSLADSGIRVEGAPLSICGSLVSKNEVISDGPFIESKEGILGYDVILAENFEHAVAIAKTCPMVVQGVAIRDVRPLLSSLTVHSRPKLL